MRLLVKKWAGNGGATRDRLLFAGIGEFSREGFAGANTARIVAAAGCNVRMIYHYFGSKMGLYRACLERVYVDLRDAEEALNLDEADPRGSIARFVAFTFDYMLDHPEFPRMMRVENLNEGRAVREIASVVESARPLMRRLDGLVRAGNRQGLFPRLVPPEHLYLNILGLSFVHISNFHTASVMLQLDFQAPAFRETRRREAIDLVLASLETPARDGSHAG